MRRSSPDLQYQPTIQLQAPSKGRLVRIGERSLSYHVVNGYCGGDTFENEIDGVIEFLFGRLDSVKVTRVGFRYVNALNSTDHLTEGVGSLALTIEVAGETFDGGVNLNLRAVAGAEHVVVTRIATPEFVVGPTQPDIRVIVDVDVATPDDIQIVEAPHLKRWIREARTFEKKAFFKLIRPEILDRLIKR